MSQSLDARSAERTASLGVRIATMLFIDYLRWHRIEGRWLITSKGFHLEAG